VSNVVAFQFLTLATYRAIGNLYTIVTLLPVEATKLHSNRRLGSTQSWPGPSVQEKESRRLGLPSPLPWTQSHQFMYY